MKSVMLHERRIYGNVTTLGGSALARTGLTPVPPYGAVAVNGPTIVAGNGCTVGNTFIYKKTTTLPPISNDSAFITPRIAGGQLQWTRALPGSGSFERFTYPEAWTGVGTINMYFTLNQLFEGDNTKDPEIDIFAARNASTASNILGVGLRNGGAAGALQISIYGASSSVGFVDIPNVGLNKVIRFTSTRTGDNFVSNAYVDGILSATVSDAINPAHTVQWSSILQVGAYSNYGLWALGSAWAAMSDFYAVATAGFPGVCTGQG